jgi:Flp pilus assembly pilin Flp
MKMASKLWMDEAGFIVSSELVLLATIVVIGVIAGMTTVRDQVVTELSDVADAISEVDQSYSVAGIVGHSATTAAFQFNDDPDFCEVAGADPSADQLGDAGTQCVVIGGVAATGEQ